MNPAPTRLNGLLLSLTDRTLVLPNTAVAEVIRYPGKPEPYDNAQDWLLGRIDWRGLKLPLISFETLSCAAPPAQGAQMAVLNLSHLRATIKFCALLLQRFPRPITLSAELARSNEPLLPLELAAICLPNNQTGKIPNLPELEETLLAAGLL